MPKKKRPPEKPEVQFKRFVEKAKELGVDDEAAKRAEDQFKSFAAPQPKQLPKRA